MEIILVAVVVSSVWVYFDAKTIGARRGLIKGFADAGPAGWAIASLFLWVLAFPLYLAKRQEIRAAALRDPPRRGGPITGKR